MDEHEDADIQIKRLLGTDAHAEYELDLQGMDQAHATESVSRMVERSRFLAPRSILVRLDPPPEGGGETLFQPIGRQLLEAKKAGLLSSLSPLPALAGRGFHIVTTGKADTETVED